MWDTTDWQHALWLMLFENWYDFNWFEVVKLIMHRQIFYKIIPIPNVWIVILDFYYNYNLSIICNYSLCYTSLRSAFTKKNTLKLITNTFQFLSWNCDALYSTTFLYHYFKNVNILRAMMTSQWTLKAFPRFINPCPISIFIYTWRLNFSVISFMLIS